jgi:mono/diheme cytochrome c family protein
MRNLSVVGLLAFLAAVPAAAAPDPATGPPAASPAERGKWLVTIGGCHDCHTPWKMGANGPENDMTRMLSGHPQDLVMPPVPALPPGPWGVVASLTNTAWAGPWGVSFTANLSPDKETGTGAWTAADFIATIRSGRHLGRGRQILPPMPWFNYATLSDDDLKAIYAYLRTIPPISNKVPEPMPPSAPPAAPAPAPPTP